MPHELNHTPDDGIAIISAQVDDEFITSSEA